MVGTLGVIIYQYMKWDSQVRNLIIKIRKLKYFNINAKKINDRPTL